MYAHTYVPIYDLLIIICSIGFDKLCFPSIEFICEFAYISHDLLC